MEFDTGSRAGSSGSGDAGGRPPGAAAAGGGEFDYRDPIQSFIVTVRRLVLEPVAFFRGMTRQGDFVNPLLFSLICWEISALIGGVLAVLASLIGLGARGVGEALVGLVGSLIFTPIFAAVVLVIAAGVLHLLVVLVARPQGTGFETTFRVVAYADVALLLTWIPLLGTLAAFVWYTVLAIFGVREAHATSTGRAAAAVLIPTAVALLLALVLIVLIGVAIFSAVR